MLLEGRPVKSITRACGRESASANAAGPTRTIRSWPMSPQHMWPLTMKASPPNMRRSSWSTCLLSAWRTRFATLSSYGIVRSAARMPRISRGRRGLSEVVEHALDVLVLLQRVGELEHLGRLLLGQRDEVLGDVFG